MNVYEGSFDGIDSIISNFEISKSDLDGVEILYAEYDNGNYEGSAWILFKKEGNLYEVNGDHCSCNGLEGQWEPTFTTVKAILMRSNLSNSVREILKTL